jgi:ADP-ribose pyrophosphatase YjhB (NUDIX family)
VNVVSAAIIDRKARRILLAQRAGNAPTYPWFWCSPGGKVELGESHRGALARELREEIDVEFVGDLGSLLYRRDITSQRSGEMVAVHCYVLFVEQLRGKPSPRDATCGLAWFDSWEVTALRLTPADQAEINQIVKLLNSFAGYSP